MSGEKTVEIFVIRESAWESLVSDAGTFGWLLILPWFNHYYGGNSGWIYAAIALAWAAGTLARTSEKTKNARKSPEELRLWLDENYPKDPK